jgi:hypothetical protein
MVPFVMLSPILGTFITFTAPAKNRERGERWKREAFSARDTHLH